MVSRKRDRGILSQSDREFALNNEEWAEGKSRPASNQREKAVVKRMRNGVIDFQHLADREFPEELIQSALYPPDPESAKESELDYATDEPGDGTHYDRHVRQGFIAAISLIYRMYPLNYSNHIVEQGVKQAVRDFYPDYEIADVSYDPDLQSPQNMHEQAVEFLEKDLTLTEEQIRVLLERGEIDPERVAEHVSKQTRMYRDQYRSIRRDEDGNPIFPPRDL